MTASLKVLLDLVDSEIPIDYQHNIKFLWHKERVKQFLSGDIYGVHPVTAEIIPSLECNYSCKHCTYYDWKENTLPLKGKRLMSEETMKTALEKLYDFGIKGVIFTGGGEPFFNKHTQEGIRYAREIGLEVGVFTNGSLLTPKSIETVLDNSRFMRISLNAITEGVYLNFHNICNPELLKRVKNNIAYTASTIEKRPVKFGIGVVVDEKNKDDLENLARFICDTVSKTNGRIDNLGIRPVINYRDRTSQISSGVLEAVRNSRPKVDKILGEVGVKVFWATDYFKDAIQAKETGSKIYTRCLANPWAVSVSYDGRVYFCSEHDGNPEFLLGDIVKEEMTKIWTSNRRKEVIDSVGDCKAPTCKLHRLNKILNSWNNNSFGGESPLGTKQIEQAETIIEEITKQGEPGGKNFL